MLRGPAGCAVRSLRMLWYGPALVPGPTQPFVLRLLGIVAAALAVAVPAAVAAPGPAGKASSLRSENARLEAQSRSAVLGLYSLDARIAASRARVAALRAQLHRLRVQQSTLRQQ